MENSESTAVSEPAPTSISNEDVSQQQNNPLSSIPEVPEVVEQQKEEEKIPLSALQRERKKKQAAQIKALQLEERLKLYEEGFEKRSMMIHILMFKTTMTKFLTRGDAKKRDEELIARVTRDAEEKIWARDNKEKVDVINEKLEEFLKEKPHFVASLEKSNNRYQDAWHLLRSYYNFSQEKKSISPLPQQTSAPTSPAATPKSAGINQGVDVMKMTDKEYDAWVATKKSRR